MIDSKKNVKLYMILGIIIVVVMLVVMWFGLGKISQNGKEINPSTAGKVAISIAMLAVLLVGWRFYKHQENLDKQNQSLNQNQEVK